MYRFFEKFPEKDREKIGYLVGSGNALRLNKILVKIIEEKFNLKMKTPMLFDEAAFGACILVMHASGFVSNDFKINNLILYSEN